MKKAIIMIRPNMYHRTKEALEKAGFSAFSAMNVHGRGKASVQFSIANMNEKKEQLDYHRFMAKKMVIVVFNDGDEPKLVETVIGVNRSGNSGDGKIFIIPVKESIRIRTGETGVEALV
jgi:nitrogen regulatory protein PII 2